MGLSPSAIGARAEAAVTAALVQAGKAVYLPAFGAHGRADLVFEDPHGLHRVQCKSGRLLGDHSIFFRACSQTGGVLRGYLGEVDFLAIYCHERSEVYLLPVEEAPSRAGHLRLRPPRNGQRRGVRWARDYLVRPVDGSAERS